jgi:hypothetical protein
MADPIVVPTVPAPSGTSTTEFKLTVAAMILGVVLETVATVLHSLQDAGVDKPWIPAVLAVIGALIQMASLFGYTKSRTVVKVAALTAPSLPK